MPTDTACDTCILINFALVERIDLLTTLTEFKFCVPEDVWAEIERPNLRQIIEQHLRSGQLQLVRLDAPEELALFAIYRQVLGRGESACLAIAENRGWAIATDESKDRKWRRTIADKKLPTYDWRPGQFDARKAPEKVTSFHQQINLPLRVGIVIDASTSISTRFEFEQQSAIEFLLQILKARSDRAFVMGFDVTPSVTADWTNNIDSLQTGIKRLNPGGGTAMFDAVYTACRDKLLDISRGQEPVRKAMILISDGDDNQSRVHLDEAIKMCQRADTIVYAISTNWTASSGRGDQVLQQLATDTGGHPFFPRSVEEMSNSFKNIEEELRSQYALSYVPADFKPNGQFRPIYLYCNDRKYIARARKGYFAPKQ